MLNTIVIEGPDGAGKSTLAQTLAKELNLPVVHTGGAASSSPELLDRMQKVEEQGNLYSTIFDRVPHISDGVYKEALDIPYLIPREAAREAFLLWRPKLVYCRLANQQAMLDNILETKKEHKSEEYLERVKVNHPRIVQAYDDEINRLVPIFPLYPFDWQRYNIRELFEWLSKEH